MEDDLKKTVLKTGTTILGIICKDGAVMAADRQTSAGHLVMNKNKRKVKMINDYLVYAGCGVASDIDRIAKIIPAQLRLKELSSKKRPTTKQAANLITNMNYSEIRKPSMIPQQAGILLGGFDEDGKVSLYSIEPAGSLIEVVDYDANFGSGMPYVLGLFERQYKEGMTLEEGIELAKEALRSSTQRDMGSGYGVDIFTITKDGIEKVFEKEIKSDF